MVVRTKNGALGAALADCTTDTNDQSKKRLCAPLILTDLSKAVITPGESLTITGQNFRSSMSATTIGLGLTAGEPATVKVLSPTSAVVSLPTSTAFGPVALNLTQDGVSQKLTIFSNGGKLDYPVITAEPALICTSTQFYDANGTLRAGTMGCGAAIAACKADGATGCVANTEFPTVDKKFAVATNIIAGVTLAGIAGSATVESHASCTADGAAGCVASSSFAAANVTGLADKILSGNTVAGVAGTAAAAPADCAADGSTSCIAVANYTAAATSGLGSKVLSGNTVAGVAGNVTLPSVGNVLTTVAYGASGTSSVGTLTLPTAANVRATNGTYGVGSSGTTPTLADCSTDGGVGCVAVGPSYAAAAIVGINGKILTGTSIGGVAGILTLPTAANVRTSNGVYGDSGTGSAPTLADCSSDGGTSCVAVASYTAAATSGLASKVVSGNTVAGTAGNVALPAIGKVLSGITYGVSGTGLTGTLTLPPANYVQASSSSYGDPGSPVTPSLDMSSIKIRPTAPTISGVSFNFSPDRITLTWGAISGATGYIVLMNNSQAVSWTPSDFTTYSTGTYGSDTMIYSSSSTSVTFSTPITAGTNYYFAIYSYETDKVYSYAPTTKTMLSCAGLAGGTWIAVPGDSIYGTNGFCVQKYVPSNVSGAPTSQTGVSPWVSISQTTALTTCSYLGVGYHLITNPEWMTIAANIANTASNWSNGVVGSGTLAAGHGDSSPNSACAADANDANGWVQTNCTGQTQGALAYNQRRTRDLSNGNVIWDIGGNVWQWVNASDSSGKPGSATNAWNEYSAMGAGTANWPRSAFVPQNSVQSWWTDSWYSAQSIGKIYPGTNGSGGALLRGANWPNGSGAGPFAVNLSLAPSGAFADIGFRCAWQP